jgi:AcrR family transcriptional regulator
MRLSKEVRKDQILSAALALFEQKGFEGVSVDEIAAKARISKGLAYHYFASKEEILLEIIRLRLDELDVLVARLKAEVSAPQRLRILVGQLIDEVVKDEKRQRFLITTFLQAQNNKLVQKAMRATPERFEALHKEEIRLIEDLGAQNAEAELPLFRASLQGMVFLYLLNPASFPIQRVAAQFMEKYGVKQEGI